MPATYTSADAAIPAKKTVAIVPNDTVGNNGNGYTNGTARAIFVGGAGAVAVVHPDGSSFTYSGCTAGTILSVQNIWVKATGTTATLLGAIY